MCGIVGIAGFMPVNQSIYDALTVLQHRGQDAAGIITIDANNCFRLRKANGLVNDVFEARHMQRLQGNMGIGHVRYPTAGSSSASEAQPFYVNSPYGITLAHNGNLTNAHELRKKLFEEKRRHINTTSDSEILLNVFASELDNFRHYPLEADNIFAAIAATNRQIRGAYACVAMIIGHGMVAFRDPNGIRPLVLGKRDLGDGLDLRPEPTPDDHLPGEFIEHADQLIDLGVSSRDGHRLDLFQLFHADVAAPLKGREHFLHVPFHRCVVRQRSEAGGDLLQGVLQGLELLAP